MVRMGERVNMKMDLRDTMQGTCHHCGECYMPISTYDQEYCDPCWWSDSENNKDNGCKGCTDIRLCDKHFKLVYHYDKRCSFCDIKPARNRGVCDRCTQKSHDMAG